MVFGARLVQEARNWRIKTPEFVHNMDHFISRCVVMDASIGHKYTINDLFQTDDVWGLVSSNASDLRRVDIRVGNSNELLTCKEAIDTVLAPSFITEIEANKLVYLQILKGDSVDNIKGLKGIGEQKAQKILSSKNTEFGFRRSAFAKYKEFYGADAKKEYRKTEFLVRLGIRK